MRPIILFSAVFLLAACHGAKPVPVVAPQVLGGPLAEPLPPDALDAPARRALWQTSFGDLPMPADPMPALKKLYARDLLLGRPAEASQVRGMRAEGGRHEKGDKPDAERAPEEAYAPAHVTDGNNATYWATGDQVAEATLAVTLAAPQVVTHVLLEEMPALGRRVGEFSVEAQVAGQWRPVAGGRGIGARRILRLEKPVVAGALRLRLQNPAACPALRRFSAYAGPAKVRILPGAADFLESTEVKMAVDQPGVTIHYTLDGSVPTAESPLYDPGHPPRVGQTCLIQAAPFAAGKNISAAYGLPPVSAQVVWWPESKLQPATAFALPLERGLNYACYEMELANLGALKNAEPTYAGMCDGFTLNVRKRDEGVALVYEGWIQVGADGLYDFSLTDDDGAQLWVGDTLVVDHDGPHPKAEKRGLVALRAGWHPLRVAWFNNAGERELKVGCFGPGCPADGEIKAERLGR